MDLDHLHGQVRGELARVQGLQLILCFVEVRRGLGVVLDLAGVNDRRCDHGCQVQTG